MERLVTEAIEKAEKSVVAIARVRRENTLRLRAGRSCDSAVPAGPLCRPDRPSFVPNEFGTGVVIDAKGLILTNYHVIGEVRCVYSVWVARKAYRSRSKPRSVERPGRPGIDAENLKPIAFGDGRAVKKGQFVIALGNP